LAICKSAPTRSKHSTRTSHPTKTIAAALSADKRGAAQRQVLLLQNHLVTTRIDREDRPTVGTTICSIACPCRAPREGSLSRRKMCYDCSKWCPFFSFFSLKTNFFDIVVEIVTLQSMTPTRRCALHVGTSPAVVFCKMSDANARRRTTHHAQASLHDASIRTTHTYHAPRATHTHTPPCTTHHVPRTTHTPPMR
jgi:hypothetical protein